MNDYASRIRDYINEPRRHDMLFRDLGRFNQLCSALDVLGDTDLAIEAYATTTSPEHGGGLYLAIYGLLQALILQQDAAFHTYQMLVENPQTSKELLLKYPQLDIIRDIRNISVGHPTRSDRKKRVLYSFISRATMRRDGFQLLTVDDAGAMDFRDIALPDLITDQKRDLGALLTDVLDYLARDEQAHKEAFKVEKLADIFDDQTGYCIEKVYEGIRRPSHAELGAAMLGSIVDRLTRLQDALERRGSSLDTYGGIKLTYHELQFPLAELDGYLRALAADETRPVKREAAEIYAYFVSHKVTDLREMAREIDDDYAN